MKQRKDQVGIDGENLIEEIASKVFFGEFVFNELWFIHKDIIMAQLSRQKFDIFIMN